MSTKTDQTPPPQALKSLYFPTVVTLNPTEHYAGGIPIRAVDGDLQGIVRAWGEMAIGDNVEVYWGDDKNPIWSKDILYDYELNQDVSFTIANTQVHEGDATKVFYRVSKQNQTPEYSKPQLTYLVKLTRPGECNDIPGEDGHSDLKFSLDYSEVGETLPVEGVTMSIVPYRNLTKYDRILARWGSQQVIHVVSPEQAQDPVSNPIKIVFSRAVIEAAGDGSRVAIAYQPIDRCGNYPDKRAPWSAVSYVLVDLGRNQLEEPQVLVKGRPTTNIDLDQLGEDDVVARVIATKTDFEVGDTVVLTWVGTTAQGPQIIVGPLELPVETVSFSLDFRIPNASVRAIAMSDASVSYVRRRTGVADRPSLNASVKVTGEISQLRAPTVDEAPGGTLPPDTTWATVNIPWYAGRNSSDLVNLIWQAPVPGGGTVYYEDAQLTGNVPENAPIRRSVSNAEIQRFKGLNVKVYYVVTNSETTLLSVRESLPFMMQVGVALPTFDRPEVEGADDNDARNLTVMSTVTEDFESLTDGRYEQGHVFTLPHLSITVLISTVNINSTYPQPPYITGRYVYLRSSGKSARFDLNSAWNKIEFGCAPANEFGLKGLISFYDEQNDFIESVSFDPASKFFTYPAPAGKKIKRFDLESYQLLIDNLVLSN